MKISGKREYLVNLESVAMTDIVLNMFIFFFISFSLLYTFSPQRLKHLDVKLPAAESAAAEKITNQAAITISRDGPVYLNGVLVTRKELKEKLNILVKDTPGIAVIVYSDKLTHFKEVVGVLDVLTEMGIKNLSIATVTE